MGWRGGICLAILLGLLPMAAQAGQRSIDPARSSAVFDIGLYNGSRVTGRFAQMQGEILMHPDGHWQVRMRFASAHTEVPGHARYTRLLRGAHFFDSQRHPSIDFVSEPFLPARLQEAGAFHGELTLRGITRRERLYLERRHCAAPLIECPIEVSGQISRSRYGMHSLRWAAADEVRFRLFLLAHATP
ncbi:hypothetical protein CO614_05220 [Lysobacteraceae bacterium NML120232]|nr:hypothetical protein CO614_05220 [Xanthomonadaceae bacterium NML120232]